MYIAHFLEESWGMKPNNIVVVSINENKTVVCKDLLRFLFKFHKLNLDDEEKIKYNEFLNADEILSEDYYFIQFIYKNLDKNRFIRCNVDIFDPSKPFVINDNEGVYESD